MRALLLAAFLHVATCGHVSINMPYLSPAGVTYVDGSLHASLRAGPAAYTTATARPFAAYASPYAAFQTAPVAAVHAAPVHHAPLAYHAPAVAYQPVTKYAAVPTVSHVPTVHDVPITRYSAQPAVIQKALDVAKPAIKTRKYEIRRPAIQKQFYDIEERIIVRPAGSALVELDQPTSKTQKGNAIISPAAYVAPVAAVHPIAAVRTAAVVPAVKTAAYVPAYTHVQPFARFGYAPYGVAGVATHFQFAQPQLTAQLGQPTTPQPEAQQPQQPEQAEQAENPQSQPQQPQQPQNPYPFERPQAPEAPQADFPSPPQQAQSDDDDTVSVENADFAARSAPTTAAPEQEPSAAEPQSSSAPAPETAEEPAARPTPAARSAASSSAFEGYSSPLDLIPQARSGPSIVPSLRNIPAEVSQSNQQRLIELLTARGGVAEVAVGRSGVVTPVGEAGQIRARVLSATPAPEGAEPSGERVNTRRVVVSRPIETLQEIEVQEPVTKLERIHVNHPTFIKTAHQDVVRVHSSVPVVGKTLAPVAHAAYPAYTSYYG